jgi:hypothetical protein
MSTIDLQKLGLPQSRMKEIIEEDYPSVSLQNRMRMIQQKFAERQLEEPKDIFGPPKNLTDVGFRFESVFNSLLGYMKQLLTSSDKVISVSEITQILQTYSQLASIYNSFVVNELPSNELFRRQIYEKLDMLASLAGKLYTDADNGIFRFSDPLTIQTLRQDIQEPSEFEQIRLRQQPILAPRLQALIEDLENKFLKAMEQIRRDALTRKLRLVDFGNDTPLPGQPRTFIREGDAPPPPPQVPPPPQPQARAQIGQPGIDERRQQQLEAIARRQGQSQRQRQPQILEGFDQPGGPYPYDQPIRPLQPIEGREQVGFFDQPGGPYPFDQPVIPLPQPRTDAEILERERRELDEEAIPLNQRELMIQNLINLHRNIPEELEERVTNYITQVLNNRPIEQLTYQQILDFTNFLRGLSYVIPDRQRRLRETALARQREQEEREEQEFGEARDEPTREEKIDFISRQLVGNRLDEGLTALIRNTFNLGNLKHKKLRDRLNTYHESVIDRLYRMSRGDE